MTIQALLEKGRAKLSAVSSSARLDTELLLAHVLVKPTSFLMTWPEHTPTDSQTKLFYELLAQRQQGTPIAYLLGQREFWGMAFDVNVHTLIPRPDTETLVETALSLFSDDQACVFLDLGTGTGAIACAVKSERPTFEVHATDCHADTLDTARHNAAQLNLPIQFHLGRWFEPLPPSTFDCIASNPPYIDPEDPHLLEGDVRFEPSRALVADNAGFADLFHLIEQAPDHLTPQGWLLLEHGYNQSATVQARMTERGFRNVQTVQDYGGQPRVTYGQWYSTVTKKD